MTGWEKWMLLFTMTKLHQKRDILKEKSEPFFSNMNSNVGKGVQPIMTLVGAGPDE
jgi:hypothetical protein